jgi:hypothetical protein
MARWAPELLPGRQGNSRASLMASPILSSDAWLRAPSGGYIALALSIVVTWSHLTHESRSSPPSPARRHGRRRKTLCATVEIGTMQTSSAWRFSALDEITSAARSLPSPNRQISPRLGNQPGGAAILRWDISRAPRTQSWPIRMRGVRSGWLARTHRNSRFPAQAPRAAPDRAPNAGAGSPVHSGTAFPACA